MNFLVLSGGFRILATMQNVKPATNLSDLKRVFWRGSAVFVLIQTILVPCFAAHAEMSPQEAGLILQQKQSCTQNADCVALQGVCDSWEAISKAHRAGFEQAVNVARPAVKCAVVPKTSVPEVGCLNGTCAIH